MNKLSTEHIRRLAPYVPIIVVIAKSDTMTTFERNRYLYKVASVIKSLNEDLMNSYGIRAIFNLFGEDTVSAKDMFFMSKTDLPPPLAIAPPTAELRRRPKGFKIELIRRKNLESESESESEFDYNNDTSPTDANADNTTPPTSTTDSNEEDTSARDGCASCSGSDSGICSSSAKSGVPDGEENNGTAAPYIRTFT